MNMNDIIYKKREGNELSKEEIDYFVQGYTKGEIPDYQASALLMAIFFKKMSKKETFMLTDSMRYSGDTIDLSGIKGIKVDKHSTGGVGDKTTLIVGPLAAACGVPVAKMSGRGLGFTGGTVDKLEAIENFQTSMEPEQFIKSVNEVGIAVIGQTAHIAAADKKLYALRDVTSTVDNISLISSSIMSKKLAAGSDAIVLDVKCGQGAFMKDLESAFEVAQYMVEIGHDAGKDTVAFITDMEQPLGRAVGNSVEVIEAIDVLKGTGPEDITELSIKLAAYMVYIGGKANTVDEAMKTVKEKLENKEALSKFADFVQDQGGNKEIINNYDMFPQASLVKEIKAKNDGYVYALNAEKIGKAALELGAGRRTKEDEIDLAAGIIINNKIGDKVKKGDSLVTIYCNEESKINPATEIIYDAYEITDQHVEKRQLIKALVTSDGIEKY